MFFLVTSFAKIGGTLLESIQGKPLFGFKTPNLLGKVKIPTLVGMCFMGMLARNLNEFTYNAFN